MFGHILKCLAHSCLPPLHRLCVAVGWLFVFFSADCWLSAADVVSLLSSSWKHRSFVLLLNAYHMLLVGRVHARCAFILGTK